ncbi:MAG: twin-arginine translocase subunit TatC [Dehalococcoidia bacterium]|nr:twin-arginine translocase subunit TatC [Dehalococcoidia bacterium]
MNDDPLPLRSHLLELRRRLTYSAISVALTTGVAFIFHRQILRFLMEPAKQFEEIPVGGPVYTTLTEFISIAFKTSLLVGLFASLPFVLYQVVRFAAPGLNKTERRYLYILMPATLLAFLAGAAFGYYVMFPPMIDFLLNFGEGVAVPMISIGNYINLILTLTFWLGIIFEMPVIIFFLAKIGLVSPDFLGRHRRYAIVVAFILGAIITPTFDPINQSLVAIPIIVLYELSIWLSKLAARGRSSRAVGAEQPSQ